MKFKTRDEARAYARQEIEKRPNLVCVGIEYVKINSITEGYWTASFNVWN